MQKWMEEYIITLIKQSLTVRLKECDYGYNGKQVRVILEWDGVEFDSDGFTIVRDEG